MGVISAVSTVLFILFANVNAKHKNTDNQQVSFLDYKTLAKKPNIRPLLYFAFLSLGAFNALTTWMESIYLEYGLTLEEAGMLTGVLIIGGIFGSPVLSALSDKLNNRSVFLVVCTFMAALLIYPMCQPLPINTLLLIAFITGFIFLPGLPILLAEAESQVSIEQTGIIASFVLWVGNLGAFVMIALTSFISSATSSWQTSVVLMMCTLLLACILIYKPQSDLGTTATSQ
jgi:nitrate/nitrite transporter NarK